MNSFGEWLQKMMNDKGLGQRELARLAHVTQGSVGNVIRGERNPGAELCRALAKALDISEAEVFQRAGLLSPEPPISYRRKTLEFLFDTASDEDQEDAIAFLQHRRELREKREKDAQERARADKRKKTGPLGQH